MISYITIFIAAPRHLLALVHVRASRLRPRPHVRVIQQQVVLQHVVGLVVVHRRRARVYARHGRGVVAAVLQQRHRVAVRRVPVPSVLVVVKTTTTAAAAADEGLVVKQELLVEIHRRTRRRRGARPGPAAAATVLVQRRLGHVEVVLVLGALARLPAREGPRSRPGRQFHFIGFSTRIDIFSQHQGSSSSIVQSVQFLICIAFPVVQS